MFAVGVLSSTFLIVDEKHMLTFLVKSSWLIIVKNNCEGLVIEW